MWGAEGGEETKEEVEGLVANGSRYFSSETGKQRKLTNWGKNRRRKEGGELPVEKKGEKKVGRN